MENMTMQSPTKSKMSMARQSNWVVVAALLLCCLHDNASAFQQQWPAQQSALVRPHITLRSPISTLSSSGRSSTFGGRCGQHSWSKLWVSSSESFTDVSNSEDIETQETDVQATFNATAASTLSALAPALSASIASEACNATSSSSSSSSPYPPAPTYRECLQFALPALGIYICSPLMSLIDTTFVGRLSTSLELAALGPASAISDSAPLPLLFLSVASTNLISKAQASNDAAMKARVTRTALTMGGVCGLGIAGLLYAFAEPISALYCGADSAALVPACTKYVAIRALALPFVVLTTIAQAVCIGTKDTKTPMITVALAGVANLLGDFLLVKGRGQGMVGAAWATAASQIVAASLLLRVVYRRGFLNKPVVEEESTSSPSNNTMKDLLAFIPFLFIMTVKMGWHNSCTSTAASLGGLSAAAHTALLSVTMVCMVLGDVGSSLSQAFLPAFERRNYDGTKTKTRFDLRAALPTIRQLLKVTLTISASVTTFAAVMIGMFSNKITGDMAVVAEMKRTLPLILATLSFHGSVVTLEGLILSQKKFRPLSIFYSFLGLSVAAFQVATRRWNWGLAGVWSCYVWFCVARFVVFTTMSGLVGPALAGFRRRVTRKMRSEPIQLDPPPL